MSDERSALSASDARRLENVELSIEAIGRVLGWKETTLNDDTTVNELGELDKAREDIRREREDDLLSAQLTAGITPTVPGQPATGAQVTADVLRNLGPVIAEQIREAMRNANNLQPVETPTPVEVMTRPVRPEEFPQSQPQPSSFPPSQSPPPNPPLFIPPTSSGGR